MFKNEQLIKLNLFTINENNVQCNECKKIYTSLIWIQRHIYKHQNYANLWKLICNDSKINKQQIERKNKKQLNIQPKTTDIQIDIDTNLIKNELFKALESLIELKNNDYLFDLETKQELIDDNIFNSNYLIKEISNEIDLYSEFDMLFENNLETILLETNTRKRKTNIKKIPNIKRPKLNKSF